MGTRTMCIVAGGPFLQPLYALLMLLMEGVLCGWSDFFQSSHTLFSLIGEGILRGWGEYPSIPTWRVLFDKGEISKWME